MNLGNLLAQDVVNAGSTSKPKKKKIRQINGEQAGRETLEAQAGMCLLVSQGSGRGLGAGRSRRTGESSSPQRCLGSALGDSWTGLPR